MEILIRKTDTRPQLKITLGDKANTHQDDGQWFVTVTTHQEAIDAAVRYLNTGNIAPSPYDCAFELPSLLRTQA